jgi:predicted nucleic acid-binding Zn ribbon protein
MAEKIPPHNHCHVCMKAVPVDENYCSEECRQKFLKMQKKRKLIVYFMYGLLAAVIVAIVLMGNV